MNAKKIVIMLLIAGVVATGAFASGDKEDQSDSPRPDWRRVPPAQAPDLAEEAVTLTGELHIHNRIHPELKSGDQVYELLVPRFYAYELDLDDGQTITVEGYAVKGMPFLEEEEEQGVCIWVTKAVIDGEEYDLKDAGFRGGPMGGPGDPRWGMGPGGRMMGPGWRPPYGHDDPYDWGRRW